MLTDATKKKINTARDILVGVVPVPTSQVEQITLAMIYKFMSDLDKKARDLGDTSGFFANGYEKYSWDKLMDKSLGARDRVKLYSEGLEKMSLNPHIPQLFRDIFKNAFLRFNNPETLKMFLDTIDQFEYDHSEELGNAFEYLLQVMGSQGDAGQFRTPRHIIDFIVEVVEPKKTDKILDPACGTAGFLIAAYKYLKKQGLQSDELKELSDNFVGYDISSDMQRLSLVNMYLHNFPDPHIYEYDSLTSEERWDDDFDVILANPPFMSPKGGIKPHSRFSVPSKRAEVLFVDYIMEHLTTRGKAGVIVPEGIIFQSQNAYKDLRKMMVDDDFLWAVVSLPSGVFQPYSGVKTSILLFDKEIAKKTNKILFVKVENDGYDLGAQRRAIKENDLPVAKALLKAYKQSVLEGKELDEDTVLDLGGSTSDKKQMQSYGYDLSADDHIELSQIINKAYHEIENKKIREGGEYNLSAERYVERKKITSEYPIFALKDITNIKRGSTITKKKAVPGDFPVIAGGMDYSYTHNEPNRDKNVITVSASGANAGYVWFHDYPIFASDCTTVEARDESKVDIRYLYYLLKGKQDYFFSLQHGGAQPHVYGKDFENLEIPLPPLSVQQEIVAELDRYQKIIDGARQVVDNYQPSFVIEDDWEWVELGEVCDHFKNGVNFSKDQVGTGTPFINIKDVFSLGYVDMDRLERVELSQKEIEKNSVNENELVFVRSSVKYEGVGFVSLVPPHGEKSVFCGFTIKCTPNVKKAMPKYLLWLLRTPGMRKEIVRSSNRANITNINQQALRSLLIPLPSLKKQSEIVRDITEMNSRVANTRDMIKMYEKMIEDRINRIWLTDNA